MIWKSLIRVQLFATPWTTQSMEFSRPEYWSESFPSSRGFSQSKDWTQVFHIVGGFFTSWAMREALKYDKLVKLACLKLTKA